MSKVEEGWCRVAHEAMLCKTPVIGSGAGGMKELLEEGKQILCEDLADLPTLLEKTLSNSETYSSNGFSFVSQFDENYFSTKWKSLLRNYLD